MSPILRLCMVMVPLLLMNINTSHSNPLARAIENCQPGIMYRLPKKLQIICISLLSNIKEMEEESDLPLDPALYQTTHKRTKDPDHVFLRFGRSHNQRMSPGFLI
eukprot:TRINITY_DN27348_c0_g1_i1.p1 TRINITY_DN27348_c0_g1~~TRINITY_DN27348_c0_g1_i1.p1  ORF type:complete len:113 (+),score=22.57 TRINITY_DN27348_c0_g1_i1:26-340(+)